jgi:SacI homology domain
MWLRASADAASERHRRPVIGGERPEEGEDRNSGDEEQDLSRSLPRRNRSGAQSRAHESNFGRNAAAGPRVDPQETHEELVQDHQEQEEVSKILVQAVVRARVRVRGSRVVVSEDVPASSTLPASFSSGNSKEGNSKEGNDAEGKGTLSSPGLSRRAGVYLASQDGVPQTNAAAFSTAAASGEGLSSSSADERSLEDAVRLLEGSSSVLRRVLTVGLPDGGGDVAAAADTSTPVWTATDEAVGTASSSAVSSGDTTANSDGELIVGIIGVVRIPGELPVVLCIRVAELAGSFFDGARLHAIYRIVEILPVSLPSADKAASSSKSGNQALRELCDLFEAGGFYFSYTFDLTTRLQIQASSPPNLPPALAADERFFWNKQLYAGLLESAKETRVSWVLPLIQGNVSGFSQRKGGEVVNLLLISRRNVNRAGTRYNTRGIDTGGWVANSVETEQIVSVPIVGDRETRATRVVVSSFVQTRGNVPLFWRQKAKLRQRKPSVDVFGSEVENRTASASHFRDHISRYGRTICVNLLDSKGLEAELGESFRTAAENFRQEETGGKENLRYEAFDFHAECAGGKFDRMSRLVDRLREELAAMRSFLSLMDSGRTVQVMDSQVGSPRTNCLDCLDRTNVVMSAFALEVLQTTLPTLLPAVFAEGRVEFPQAFAKLFKEIWADNGDAISRFYAGTNALKGDFTRTGKRRAKGVMNDGINRCVCVRAISHPFFMFSDNSRMLFAIFFPASRGTSRTTSRIGEDSARLMRRVGVL